MITKSEDKCQIIQQYQQQSDQKLKMKKTQISITQDQLNKIEQLSNKIISNDIGYLKQVFTQVTSLVSSLVSQEKWSINKMLYGNSLNYLMRVLTTEIQIYSDCANFLFPQWRQLKIRYMRITKTINLQRIEYAEQLQNQQIRAAKQRNKLFQKYENNYRYAQPITMTENGSKQIKKNIQQTFPKTNGWNEIFSCLKRKLRVQNQQLMFKGQIHQEKPLFKDNILGIKFFYQGYNVCTRYIDSFNQIETIASCLNYDKDELKAKVEHIYNSKQQSGVILFDVYPCLNEISVEGVFVTKSDKKLIQQRIKAQVKQICQEIALLIKLSWVPVKEDPCRYLASGDGQRYLKRKQIKGKFVLRLQFEKKQQNICASQEFEQEEVLELQRKVDQVTKPPKTYKNQSLLIVDRTSKSQVEELFKQSNFDFFIEQCFPQYNFRLSSTTWILHHNDRFEKVKMAINKKELKYGNQNTVTVVKTLKQMETSKLDSTAVENLNVWIKNIDSEESIALTECNYGCRLSVKNNINAIFLYMLFGQFQISIRFCSQR